MSGLCGWFFPRRGVADAEQVLAGMGSGLPSGQGAIVRSAAAPDRGLLVSGADDLCHFHDDGQILAALSGHPEWKSAELGALAASEGHAKALALAYRKHGRDAFSQVHGPCAWALLDAASGRAAVAIDRIGVTQMCFADRSGGFVFGTTTDSVRAHPAASTATISAQAVFDYLYFTRSPAPGTIYKEQRKLAPAQGLWHENGATETEFYWHMPFVDGGEANIDALSRELRDTLRQAVQRAVAGAGTTSVGAFLSGGLDSTTIVGLLRDILPASAAFTIGFDAESYNETQYAAEAARHYGTKLHEYYVVPNDIIELAPRIARAYDEPFGNSSAVPTYFCAHLARAHGVSLMLAGDGGNELFAGNKRYAQQKVFAAYGLLPPWLRDKILEPLLFSLPGGSVPLVRRAQSYVRRANTPMPERIETYNYYRTVPLAYCFRPDAAAEIDPGHPDELMRSVYERAATASILNRMLHVDLQMTLADDDLRKVGRMCELAGVDVRFPFLDEAVAELSARVPPGIKLKGLSLRHFYRKAMGGFLPRISLTKPKHGFGTPFGFWLRRDKRLQELAFGSLMSLKNIKFFEDAFLDGVVRTFLDGHESYHGELIWVLMMLDLWLREHGRALPAPGQGRPESVPDGGALTPLRHSP
ncbi:MAG: asparagine synthase-related protein [Alphaproteobacteria bacterium]